MIIATLPFIAVGLVFALSASRAPCKVPSRLKAQRLPCLDAASRLVANQDAADEVLDLAANFGAADHLADGPFLVLSGRLFTGSALGVFRAGAAQAAGPGRTLCTARPSARRGSGP